MQMDLLTLVQLVFLGLLGLQEQLVLQELLLALLEALPILGLELLLQLVAFRRFRQSLELVVAEVQYLHQQQEPQLVELELLEQVLIEGGDLRADERIASHADWAEELKTRYRFTPENTGEILRQEVGRVFMQVLTDAGVYKRDEAGKAAFLRFIDAVNR